MILTVNRCCYLLTGDSLFLSLPHTSSCRPTKECLYVENKRPTRCNRLDFYCKTYCPLSMFRPPLCSSSGAQELYRWFLLVVHGSLVYRSLVWCGAVGFMCPGCPADDGHNVARNMLSGQ